MKSIHAVVAGVATVAMVVGVCSAQYSARNPVATWDTQGYQLGSAGVIGQPYRLQLPETEKKRLLVPQSSWGPYIGERSRWRS